MFETDVSSCVHRGKQFGDPQLVQIQHKRSQVNRSILAPKPVVRQTAVVGDTGADNIQITHRYARRE